jgi:hypothetical protein
MAWDDVQGGAATTGRRGLPQFGHDTGMLAAAKELGEFGHPNNKSSLPDSPAVECSLSGLTRPDAVLKRSSGFALMISLPTAPFSQTP